MSHRKCNKVLLGHCFCFLVSYF